MRFSAPIRPIAIFLTLLCFPLLGETIPVQDLSLALPSGWKQTQDAYNEKTILKGFSNGSEYLNLYVKWQAKIDMRGVFANGSQVSSEGELSGGLPAWKVIKTSKQNPAGGTVYVTAFMKKFGGYTYYGFSRSSSASKADDNVQSFITGLKPPTQAFSTSHSTRSLTGVNFLGKKYYLGMGAVSGGDPQAMHNEVSFDVAHTNNIFTKDTGGGYLPTTLNQSVSGGQVTQAWNKIGQSLTDKDMFIQYSSSHGMETGLGIGVSYNQIRDKMLSYPAQEILVFTMACFSGNLIDAFNAKKSVWQDWGNQGRTLFVMASSANNQLSWGGPGTDPEESSGAYGSAGSLFGFSLWKALLGYSDGYVDGVKDGYLQLDEISTYVSVNTGKETFQDPDTGQTVRQQPKITGVYNRNLIINRVLPKELREQLELEAQRSPDGVAFDALNRVIDESPTE